MDFFKDAIAKAKDVLLGKEAVPLLPAKQKKAPQNDLFKTVSDFKKKALGTFEEEIITPVKKKAVKVNEDIQSLTPKVGKAFGDIVIGKKRSVNQEDIGGISKVLYDVGTSFLRAPIAITNYAQGTGNKFVNKAFNTNLNEDTNSWAKNASKYLDDVSPEAGAAYKAFLGVDKTNDDVSVDRAGKEWADVVNMALPKGKKIKEGSKLIPIIGIAGTLLDGSLGGNSSRVAMKSYLRKAKSLDEVVEGVRGFTTSGTEDEVTEFAKKLWDSRAESDLQIQKLIESEHASNSNIRFLEDVARNKGTSYEDVLKENIAKRNKDVATKKLDLVKEVEVPKIKTIDDIATDEDFKKIYDNKLLSEDIVDDFVVNIDKVNEIDDVLESTAKNIEEVDDSLLKEIKTKYNLKEISNFDYKTKKKFMEDLVNKLDDFESNKKLGNLSKMVREIQSGLIDGDYLEVVDTVENFTEHAVKNMVDLRDTTRAKILNGDNSGAISDILKSDVIESAYGKGLRAVQDIKKTLKLDTTETRLKQVISALNKKGMSESDISKLFTSYIDENKIKTIADLDTKQLDEIYASSFSSGQKVADMIEQYRYSNMLSGVATHLINFSSNQLDNTLFKPAIMIGEAIADALGIAKSGARANDVAVYLGTVFNQNNIKNAWKHASEVLNEVEDLKQTDLRKVKYKGGAIAKAYRFPLRLLGASDALSYHLYKSANEAVEIRRIMKKNDIDAIEDLTPNLRMQAIRKADRITEDNIFRMTEVTKSDGMITRLFKGTAAGINNANKQALGIPKVFIPFVNTLAVIGKKNLRRTPVIGVLDALRFDTGTKKFKVIDDLGTLAGEQMLGMSAMLGGYAIARSNEDIFKGDRPKEQTEYQYSDKEGTDYNSVRIGDKWNDLDFIGPTSVPVLLGMKLAEIEKRFNLGEIEKDKLLAALGLAVTVDAFKNSFNNEFMKSTTDAVSILSGSEPYKVPSFVANAVRQFAPMSSMMGALNKVFNDNRKIVSPETIDEIIGYAFRDMPNFKKIIETGEYSTISENFEQNEDPDGIKLFHLDESGSTFDKAMQVLSPTRPKTRDENIHAKYLDEKEKNLYRDSTNEALDSFSKNEEKRIEKLMEKAYNNEDLTKEEADILNNLPDDTYLNYQKKVIKKVSSKYLNIYRKAVTTEDLTKEEADILNNLPDDVYEDVQKTYEDGEDEKYLLVMKKAIETEDKLTKKEADLLNSFTDEYYAYLEEKYYNSAERKAKNVSKEEELYLQ